MPAQARPGANRTPGFPGGIRTDSGKTRGSDAGRAHKKIALDPAESSAIS